MRGNLLELDEQRGGQEGRQQGGQTDDMMRGDTRREGGGIKRRDERREGGMLRERTCFEDKVERRFRGSIHDSGLVSSPERS